MLIVIYDSELTSQSNNSLITFITLLLLQNNTQYTEHTHKKEQTDHPVYNRTAIN